MMIRPATLADAPALAAFGEKTFFDTFGHLYPEGDSAFFTAQRFSQSRTREDISEQGRYIQLAFVDGQLVGFLDCGALGLRSASKSFGVRGCWPSACRAIWRFE